MTQWPAIELAPEAILFADDDLVAVDKPSGVLCDASIDPNREHLGTALGRWAQTDDAEFHPAHRLDRGTSGVVLFARNRAAATALMHQFQERTVTKQYQAVVVRLGNDDWAVGDTFERRSYLRHRRGETEEVRSGGKPSHSSFQVEQLDGPLALVRAFPKSGRTHQLRVHLSALDAPIVGDDLYGFPRHHQHGDRLWLHADTLDVAHPVTQERLVIRSTRSLHVDNGSIQDRARPK